MIRVLWPPPPPAPGRKPWRTDRDPTRSRSVPHRHTILIAEHGLSPGDFRLTLRDRWADARKQETLRRQESMAIEITTVAERQSTSGPKIVEVPEDVAAELEQLYSHLVENPGQLPLITADDPGELRKWLAQAKAWGETRDGGTLEVRKSPKRGLPENQAVVRIRPPLTEAEKEANRAANEKSKAKADA